MSPELEYDLRQITQVFYCDIGAKELDWFIKYVKPFCIAKQTKQILKIVKNQKRKVDKRFEEYYNSYKE